MSRLVYASPDDSFWDTLVVLALSEDSETMLPGDDQRKADDESADRSAEQRPPPRRHPR